MQVKIKSKFKLIFFMMVIITVLSCRKKTEETITEVLENNKVSCDINGKSWSAATAVYGLLPFDMKVIIGTSKDQSTIGLTLTKIQAVVGEIALKPNIINGKNENRIIYHENGKGKTYCPFEGKINITEISEKRIKGTFNFKAEDNTNKIDTVEVTNGKFDVAVTKPKEDLKEMIEKN